ncbi:hypothetical protein [Streptomyces luteolus]|uniref:Uncharacterized protein n=1 Tax=Streptomyces luteolus TaxID=3043615 RepID=A0ABT6SZG5_9ACTN|nr:hypothetical protein [Streptomyces sp. B-S-A12]MDI3420770.1 hypothetical protein [Streptomyces sp. B-S-A12]
MSYPTPTMNQGQRQNPERRPAHVASPTDTGMIPLLQQPEAPQQPTQRRIFSPGFGLRGPRRNRHVVTSDEIAAIGMPIGDDGVIIGTDTENQPAVLGLARPTPFDVCVVGGLWLAQVLALRSAATGARVAVETGRPQVWTQLAQAAGGGQQCVTVYPVGRVPAQGPSVSSPVVLIRDCGVRPPRGRVTSLPWQAVVTVLPYVGEHAPRWLSQAQLVGIQRISPQETEVVRETLGVPADHLQLLPTLSDNVALWCTRKHRKYVMTEPTDAENGLLGAARRMD